MDKNRPIVTATLGYIMGIIWGLYFNKSIVSYFVFIMGILMITYLVKMICKKTPIKKEEKQKFKFFSLKRIFRYIKLILNINEIAIIIIFFIISNFTVQILNQKYENLYSNLEEVNVLAKVIDNGHKKEYSTVYKIKIEAINNNYKYANTNLYLKINNHLNINLQYGNKIQIQGIYIEPEMARNYKGFDYCKYLKTLKIYGTVKANKIKIIEKNTNNSLFFISNTMFLESKQQLEQTLSSEHANLLLGILFGYTDEISEQNKEAFKSSNLSHILAVSGMHISYIILATTIVVTKTCGKRISPVITIIFIFVYMCITNFSPSVTRAGIMAIIVLIAKITHNKNDICTSISLSLLIILIWNPYLISNAGVLLSYGGTIGILLFQKTIKKIFNNVKSKSKFYKYKANKICIKIIDYIQDILAVSISAQLIIAPITTQIFNTYGVTFFITNFLVSLIIGPIIIIGFLFIISSILYQQFSHSIILNLILKLIHKIFKFSIQKLLFLLTQVSKMGKVLPFSNIKVVTLPIWLIIVYYIVILIFNLIYKIKYKKVLSAFDKRVINWKNLIKHRIIKNRQKIIVLTIVSIIILCAIKNSSNNLKIHFIDVGQGDSTLITTPNGKNILIDGGGDDNYDVGKNILLPYLLDRGITKIDCMIISHFDKDHVGGLLIILEEIKVDKVIIGKQYQNSEQYEKFLQIIKNKRIQVKQVLKGDKINIEKDVKINILFPEKELIIENSLNNNSLVFKLEYKEFSALFTGDIEKIAEEKLIKLYKKNNILKSDILKVAHHGAKTSTTQKFLDAVLPQISVISVGKNNLYGHPSIDTIKRLEDLNIEIYRTDKCGEITIIIDKKGRIIRINCQNQ